MKSFHRLTVLLMALLGIQSVSAVELMFDDLQPALTAPGAIPDGYGGVNWNSNIGASGEGAAYCNKQIQYRGGYWYGVVSGLQAAYSHNMYSIVIEGSSFNFESAYITAASNPHYITLEGYNGTTLLYSRTIWVVCEKAQFFNLNFANVTRVVIDPTDPFDPLYSGNHIVLDNVTITAGRGEPPPVDSDEDGVADAADAFPHSRDVGTNVIINGGDTGVPSLVFPNGSTLSDLIYQIAAEANNHGQFVGGVAQLKNQLRKEALLTAAQAATIQECAARSSLP